MAIWELAPGSPWNAIFSFLVMSFSWRALYQALSFCQHGAGGFEVAGVSTPRGTDVDDGESIRMPASRPELLELLALLPAATAAATKRSSARRR
jgi:hypothetical protein